MKKNTCKSFFIFTFLVSSFIFANAQTYVTGGIYSNTTWTIGGSPYIIIDTVVIFQNITLTIQPGVVVKFNHDALIDARGNLFANGTITDSITFTSNSVNPYAGIYQGINYDSDSSSYLYCHFSYATNPINVILNRGYLINSHCLFISNLTGRNGDQTTIDSCTFEYDSVGVTSEGPELVTGCTFLHNGTAINMLDGTIYNCIIQYNHTGIRSESSHITFNDISNNHIGIQTADFQLSCNTICNNTYYNVIADAPGNEMASYNYWCLSDSAAIQATIYDAYQDINLGFVFFTPFDTIPCANIPTAVKEITSISNEIQLFPNPNNGIFTIQLTGISNSPLSVEVYNMLGEKVYTSTISQHTSYIKLGNSSPGVYLYRILSMNSSLIGTGKFVVE